MKVAYLVVFDVPKPLPPSAEAVERARATLFDVVRKNTETDTEVAVLPHALTPAELAALP